MATGTPVIARRAGGLTETIEHNVTGFLVDDLTEAQLAVQHVRELTRSVVRQHVIEHFLPARMVDEYEQVYRRLAGGSHGSVVPLPIGTRSAAGVPG
jgi:glycosyltransferase involved in cell wall biosynthesis